MLAALAEGTSELGNLAPGNDCRATLNCLEALGVRTASAQADGGDGPVLRLEGRGPRGLRAPASTLDALNSGTTTRLLAGILAAHPFSATLTGDASLRSRPMRRVIEPLERMGARLESSDGRLPLTVHGGDLCGIEFAPAVPSAQVKSAVLLAGLQATGNTTVREPAQTRDHTELALRTFGVEVVADGALATTLRGGQVPRACRVRAPGDPSSAAFWAVAAAGLPGSEVEIHGVGLNPTRVAFLDVLRRAGAAVEIEIENPGEPEPVGTIRVGHGPLCPVTILPADVPSLIDELPVLAALATFGGAITVTGAAELRVKESDRISSLVAGLRALGAHAEEWPDGFAVEGGQAIAGGTADACGDHRLAMAFAIAALGGRRASIIRGAEAVSVSYPRFFDTLEKLEIVRTDKIYLVGFMAAGKSSLARALATRLGWRSVDVDEMIEARERQTIAQLFAQRGEAYFRSVERLVVTEILAERHVVVATGGGTFVDAENRAAMKSDGAVIWLDVPLGELVTRIPLDGSRPLAADRRQFEQLFESRRAAYRLAHVRLDASKKSVGSLVELALDWLGE